MVFCNNKHDKKGEHLKEVTILILVDGFLQYKKMIRLHEEKISHNPYFSRWFSAIRFWAKIKRELY